MIQRDFLMRQIHQLAQVLQKVLLQRQQGQHAEALQAIHDGLAHLDDGQHENLRRLPLAAVLRFCTRDGTFTPALATLLADLLREEGDLLLELGQETEAALSYERALLLYEASRSAGSAALPWDIETRLDRLRMRVGADAADAIARLVDGMQ